MDKVHKNSTPGIVAHVWQIERLEIDAIKFESMQIHFFQLGVFIAAGGGWVEIRCHDNSLDPLSERIKYRKINKILPEQDASSLFSVSLILTHFPFAEILK